VFFDAFQADIGSCCLEDAAATVLTTIAGHYPERNQILIDAGALALSKDPGATQLDRPVTFGVILNHPEMKLVGISQEHGIVTGDRPIAFEQYPVGSHLRVIPNHSCLSAALFGAYHVVENDIVVDQWVPQRGW
jgi:D-serine deaminase-like pyridoxal phosphate-dependent protein